MLKGLHHLWLKAIEPSWSLVTPAVTPTVLASFPSCHPDFEAIFDVERFARAFLLAGCSFVRSTSLPFFITQTGVPVLSPSSKARFAARRKARSTSCASGEGELILPLINYLQRISLRPGCLRSTRSVRQFELAGLCCRRFNFLREQGAKKVWLFGSLAKGRRPTVHSDFDFAVEGLPGDRLFGSVGHLLQVLPRPVDIVEFENCSTLRREQILEHGIILYDEN
jgi:predicted nucleotidyltransferase